MNTYAWHAHYPKGIAHEIKTKSYADLPEMIQACCTRYKDAVAFVHMNTILRYGDLDKHSTDFAAFLQQKLGLRQGDRIALQMPNLLQFPIACLGALRAGLVVVNVNPLYTAREMQAQFNDAGVLAIVILNHFADKIEEILPNTPISPSRVVLSSAGDMFPFAKRAIVSMALRFLKRAVPAYTLPEATPFREALSIGRSCTLQVPKIQGKDHALLQYTGGTTGASKAAILTHENILSNVEQMMAWIGSFFEKEKETILTALPLYHSFAFTCSFLLPLQLGARNVLVTDPRQMKMLLDTMKDYPFTFMVGVNTLFNALLRHPAFARLDFSKGKIAVAGGMALQAAVAEGWKKTTGFPLIEGYGLSETSPVLAVNPPDGKHRVGTVGLPMPSTEVRLLDEGNKEVKVGDIGEVCVKGPQVMQGYWQRDEENKRAFVDGYFKTGDMGVFDEDGFLSLVDRKKDMIIVSGFKAYPNEIEEVLAAHPKVYEIGVVGAPTARQGEQMVKAFIVKADPSLTEEEVKSYARENLADYKVPGQVAFVEALPKSNVGKILRRKLLEDKL